MTPIDPSIFHKFIADKARDIFVTKEKRIPFGEEVEPEL